MLQSLSIRDVVLIERLDLSFESGLCVLTGETGAGKSILLDALGLALGMRATPGLVRRGARQAGVTAAFELPRNHAAFEVLKENGFDPDGNLVLRRVLTADGRSRAFVNDQPASVGLLKRLGDSLIEIQGQGEQQGLLDSATHRGMLDLYGGLLDKAAAVASAWQAWRGAEEELAESRAILARAREEEALLRHASAELEALDPQAGEEEQLASARTALMHQEKLIEAMNIARESVSGAVDIEGALRTASAALEKAAAVAAGRLDPALEAFGRATVEVQEAVAQLEAAAHAIDTDPARLQEIEERYFALKDMARKHKVTVEELPEYRARVEDTLAALDDQSDEAAQLEQRVGEARDAYIATAEELRAARKTTGATLDAAIAAELPPLKFEKGAFLTRVDALPEADWGPAGMDRVRFDAATNPGAPPEPIAKVASGGELSRLMLALKVVLARVGTAPTLVFDEVDSGIGGATAHAVGERLARLGNELQVLVVTHSPQVAARGGNHWRLVKSTDADGAVTSLHALVGEDRREEIARMLSGQQITDEARAAADSLLAGERLDA